MNPLPTTTLYAPFFLMLSFLHLGSSTNFYITLGKATPCVLESTALTGSLIAHLSILPCNYSCPLIFGEDIAGSGSGSGSKHYYTMLYIDVTCMHLQKKRRRSEPQDFFSLLNFQEKKENRPNMEF
jgi:hypothetical protein